MLRPSLSAGPAHRRRYAGGQCVAGVYAPAFVERGKRGKLYEVRRPVSPGFMLRPSLSDDGRGACAELPQRVSPGFMLRPSLSAGMRQRRDRPAGGRVAGVYAPAFVERARAAGRPARRACSVAGVYAPAFVERGGRVYWQRLPTEVAGVAGVYAPAFVERARPAHGGSSRSPRVAGVYAPAFVERSWGWRRRTSCAARCRRGLCSGLR